MTQMWNESHPRHPLPGSPEAIDLGCDCSAEANNNGIGIKSDRGIYWVVPGSCLIHSRSRWSEDSFDYLREAWKQARMEANRYFLMKRVNAGLYAHVRQQVQKARAVLGASLELYGNSTVGTALDILGELPPTDLHLHDLLNRYRARLQKERAKIDDVLDVDQQMMDHVISMCTLTQDWFDRGESDKANRWLGFIQGFLWRMEIFTIDEMREHIKGGLP